MKNKFILFSVFILLFISTGVKALDYWPDPFSRNNNSQSAADSILSLEVVLRLVANQNPSFESFGYQLQASQSSMDQVKRRSNPELGLEFEEFGWNSPGFKESEFSISLAQEFEFFGQRKARIDAAQVGIETTKLQIKMSAFDLYLESKQRFYTLVHAQQKVILSQASHDLAKEIVGNIKHRLDKGAALQAEFLLAQLEEQRAKLDLGQSEQEVKAKEASLVSLWGGQPTGVKVVIETEPDFTLLFNNFSSLTGRLDSTREMLHLHSEANRLKAENSLAKAEARPTITLSGGFKRFEVDNSKSFLFGVSLPLPFFNRNQGTQKSLEAQLRSLEYNLDQQQNEIRSEIEVHTIRLKQFKYKHDALDTLLLPTAKSVYQTLKNAYDAGRIPYTQLLEAERTLNDLSFEHNDILFEIYIEIIRLEHRTGVVMRLKEEK